MCRISDPVDRSAAERGVQIPSDDEIEAYYHAMNKPAATQLGITVEEYEQREREHYAAMEAEDAAQDAAGGRTICPKCNQRKVVHRSVCTLGYPGHPGAEFSDLGECEGCGHGEL